ncbi:A-kinase anchor protein 13-like isoform X3 [Saccostrea echinata]|uniref:A-kinase anchor protein 13-like isoform X3 n=1 Tax=Saccostrea echinata TaxID=191078 RepID=UPI002A7F51D7|nr:A-kinase anchor protein 13-like isoform X3 [Saccostrea echinata]
MAFDKNSSPVYGGGQISVDLSQGVPLDSPLYLVFEGPYQRHITVGIRYGNTCWAVIPAHGEAEKVQLTLFSYYNNDICALVTSAFDFYHDPTYFLACFLVESVYNIAALEDLELIKSEKFDLGEEDLDTLDQRLYLALKYLEIPEWWHILGPNSPAVSAEHIPRETLLHFVARLGLKKVALFLLDKNGAQEALHLHNRYGNLPKDLAAENGHSELASILAEFSGHSITLYTEPVATEFGIICQLDNGQKSMSTITRRPVEEDIYIYHEMISQEEGGDNSVQLECQTVWPVTGTENDTESQSVTEMEDGENKLQTIIEKTRTLQDAIKNVTNDDLDNSLEDLESPGHSMEDLSDVMSDRGEMDQGIYDGTLTAVQGLNEDLFKLRDFHRNKLQTQDHLARHSNSCPSLENEGRFSPLPVVQQGERRNSMLNLAKDDVEPFDSQYSSRVPHDSNDTPGVQIYVNGKTVEHTDSQEEPLDSSLNNFLKDFYGGNTPGVRRRSWGPNLMTQNAIGHRINKKSNPVLSGKSCSLNSLDGDDSDNEMSNDETDEQKPASPTESHDQVVPPVAMEGLMVTSPTSSHSRNYNHNKDDANQGQTLTRTLHSMKKELVSPRQTLKSLSQDGETTMSGQSGDSTDEDMTSNLNVPHSTMTKSMSTPSIPAAVSPTEKKSFQKEAKQRAKLFRAQFRRQEEIHEDDDERTNRLLGRNNSKSRRKSELSLLDFLTETANYTTDEQAKIAKREKEEKDKKRKSSVFSRLGSSYRTKKHKEKENKGRHGHNFVSVSFSNSTSCDVCSKSMANKAALRCENCSINVHENSCKEQSPHCDKNRHTIRVPQRGPETGSMTNLHTQDKQLTAGTAYSGLRPTQSFKERSPSAGVPLRNQVTSSSSSAGVSLSAIPDSSEPDENQGDRHHAALHRRSLPNASYSMSPQYQRPGYQHWRRAREKLMGIDKAIHEETDQDRQGPGQDLGQIGLSSANSNSLESLDDVDAVLEVTSHIDEDLRNLSAEEPETWSETIEKKKRKHFNSQEIKRQDTIWELIQTERHHCRTLKILQRVYAQGILHDLHMPKAVVDRLFPKLDELIEVHMGFLRNLQELQRRHHDRSVEKIGDTLLNHFSGESAEKMKCAYGAFCCGHKDSVLYYKDLLIKDRKFLNFIKKCNNDPLLQKREIPDFVLLVTQRLSKYLGLLDTLIKRTTGKAVTQRLSKYLGLLDTLIKRTTGKAVTQRLSKYLGLLDTLIKRTTGKAVTQRLSKYLGLLDTLIKRTTGKAVTQRLSKYLGLLDTLIKRTTGKAVTQRLSKYLGLLDTLIKRTTVKEERQNISQSLQLSKEILQSVDDQVHEQERIQRLREIYEGFDPRATTFYKGKKFKKSDISSHGRKLVKEGTIGLKSARGKVTEAIMVVLTDLIFFMQEQNGKYTFFSQDNKSCAIPLFELLVREKSDTKESKGIYLISQNKLNPEMYEIVCNTNSEREAWIREIRAASEKCPADDEYEQQEDDEEERRQMEARSAKIKEIIEQLHKKDDEIKSVCDTKNQLMIELLEIYNMRDQTKRPDSMGSEEGSEHMDALQAALQHVTVTASNLTNMLEGGDSGHNQLMRHVSSVGEHVSSSYQITPMAKRAETFAGFDTTFDLSKGHNGKRYSQVMDSESQLPQTDSDSELSYDQQSMYMDSNDSSSCNYDSQSIPGSVMEIYSSQPSAILTREHITTMQQLSTSLNSIVHLTARHGTEVESLKAQLADANERINKLSAEVHDKRGGSYRQHHTLEELRNIQEQVQREKAVLARQRENEMRQINIERALLDEQRKQLEKDQADLLAKKEDLKRQKEAYQRQIDMWQQEKIIHRDSPVDKTVNSQGGVVLRDKENLKGSSSTDPKNASCPDSPSQNSHRRSASADFCSMIEGDLERLKSGHMKTTRRELPVRPDQPRGVQATASFSSSVSSKLAGNKSQKLPAHLLSAKNEQKKSGSPSPLSQTVGSNKGVQQVLPFKLADAGSKSVSQQITGSQSVSNLYKSNRPQQQQKSSSSSSLLGGVLKLAEPGAKGKTPNNNGGQKSLSVDSGQNSDAKNNAQEKPGHQKNGSGIFYM